SPVRGLVAALHDPDPHHLVRHEPPGRDDVRRHLARRRLGRRFRGGRLLPRRVRRVAVGTGGRLRDEQGHPVGGPRDRLRKRRLAGRVLDERPDRLHHVDPGGRRTAPRGVRVLVQHRRAALESDAGRQPAVDRRRESRVAELVRRLQHLRALGGSVAIAFRASASATTQSGATTITIPGTVQAGDALIIAGGMNDAGVSDFDWPTPSGWTRLQHSRVGSDVYGALYGKVATASDAGAQVVLDTDTTGKSGVVLAAYSGTDPVAPFHATAQRVENTSTTNHATPTVGVTVEDAQIVIAAIPGNSAVESWGTASGHPKRA